MSLLHRNTFHPASDLFRLLDEASSLSTAPSSNRRTFSPNFDVHETDKAYILEGELPGLEDKRAIHLEFTDPQTLLVRGRIERSHQIGQPPRVTEAEDSETSKGKNQEEKAKSHEENGQENGGKQESGHKNQQPRYWVSERSVGEFQRSFSFPTPVDVDNVKAGLEHGILKVTVPKVEQKKGRRILIS